ASSLYTLSLHDALPIYDECAALLPASIALDDGDLEGARRLLDRLGEPENKHALGVYFLLRGRALLESESLAYGAGGSRAEKAARSEEHTSELQSRENLV